MTARSPAGAVVLGIDAAGGRGWVGVAADAAGFAGAWVAATVAELIDAAEVQHGVSLAAVGVDIPIGLVAAPSRAADVAARAFVGPRRSSVFPAPHPEVLDLDDHAAVNVRLAELGMPGLSIQGFRLFPRIREVAALAAHDERIVEIFPEASFCAMAGRPLTDSKKTWNGAAERRVLLAAADPAIVLPNDLDQAGGVPADDVLDAAAVAWSAWRVATGTAERLGDDTEVDSVTGRPIAVWV